MGNIRRENNCLLNIDDRDKLLLFDTDVAYVLQLMGDVVEKRGEMQCASGTMRVGPLVLLGCRTCIVQCSTESLNARLALMLPTQGQYTNVCLSFLPVRSDGPKTYECCSYTASGPLADSGLFFNQIEVAIKHSHSTPITINSS